MSEREIEVYEVGAGLSGREVDTALDLLAAGSPVPAVGDILLMNALRDEGILMGNSVSAFRVVEREYLFSRQDPTKPAEPQTFLKVCIHVRRLTREEYFATPGTSKT